VNTATASNGLRGGGRDGRLGSVVDKGLQPANSCEDVRAAGLRTYIEAKQLLPSLGPQSIFHSGHSAETALLHVPSDISAAVDRGDLAALAFLDLCATFDTVESTTRSCCLLERLWRSFGITGKAVILYQLDRRPYTQRIRRGGSTPRSTVMGCGVPQDSVLSPDLVPAIHG
jgi:hypothetical protein